MVQIALIKQEWIDSQKLWVPEAARSHWYWVKRSKDDITGFWEVLKSARGGDLRRDLEQDAEWKVESMSLDRVLHCIKETGSRHQWRNCEFDTLTEIINKLLKIIKI